MPTPSVVDVQKFPSNVTLRKKGNVFESDPQTGTTVVVASTVTRDVRVTLALDPASPVKFGNNQSTLVSDPVTVPADQTAPVRFDSWMLRRSSGSPVGQIHVAIEPRYVNASDTDPVNRTIILNEVTTESVSIAATAAVVAAGVVAGVGVVAAVRRARKAASKKEASKKEASKKEASKKSSTTKSSSKKSPTKKSSTKKSSKTSSRKTSSKKSSRKSRR